MTRRRIAVIGSGVAGLTAAHVLQKQADVTLYEASNRLGGHAHTHDLVDEAGHDVSVDTGFIVHNVRTYPNLLRLFGELDITTQESEMSMSISCAGCGLEYAGALGLSGLFAQAANARNLKFLYLLSEVKRFHRRAQALLAADDGRADITMDEFLARGRFSRYFRLHFMTPLISAVWSCAPSVAGRYPARYLFRFLDNHGMLSVTGSPQWRTVTGGSARYVEQAAKGLSGVLTSTPVRSVRRLGAGANNGTVELRDDTDTVVRYDGAVLACHPNQALSMLAEPTVAEQSTLSAIGYSTNPTLLHTDASVLPRAAKAHASWNYRLPACDAGAETVHVSYDMNRLQRLDSHTHYLVTLNGDGQVAPDRVIDRMVYEHPIFTPESVSAQSRLPKLNDGTLAFAGAYHGWGFHEDGCRSGVDAAASLGVSW